MPVTISDKSAHHGDASVKQSGSTVVVRTTYHDISLPVDPVRNKVTVLGQIVWVKTNTVRFYRDGSSFFVYAESPTTHHNISSIYQGWPPYPLAINLFWFNETHDEPLYPAPVVVVGWKIEVDSNPVGVEMSATVLEIGGDFGPPEFRAQHIHFNLMDGAVVHNPIDAAGRAGDYTVSIYRRSVA